MRFDALVIEEPRQPSVLRHGSGCGIRLQLAGELLLKPFNQVLVEVCSAPEHVYVTRRRVKDVARGRQVPTRVNASEYRCAVVVGVEKDMSNRADVRHVFESGDQRRSRSR